MYVYIYIYPCLSIRYSANTIGFGDWTQTHSSLEPFRGYWESDMNIYTYIHIDMEHLGL